MKLYCIFLLLIFNTLVYSESVNDIQTLDGAQRNRLTDIINTVTNSGGGGGGGGTIITNTANNWSMQNTFNGNTSLLGSFNQIGTSTSTNRFDGSLLFGTNAFNSGEYFANFRIPNTSQETFNFDCMADANAVLFDMGNEAQGGKFAQIGYNNSQLDLHGISAGVTLNMGSANTDQLVMSGGNSITIGHVAGDILTLTGNSLTIPNNLTIGTLFLQSSGTATNTSSMVCLGSFTATNIINSSANLTGVISTGTGTNLLISVNGGASPMQTAALMTTRTNAQQGVGATPTINVIYTNNNQRTYISAGVLLPCSASLHSAASVWTVSGTFTNYQGISSSLPSLSGNVETNFVAGFVDPNALYMITNIEAGAGAATVIQTQYTEKGF